MPHIGERIREFRRARGLTQQDLAHIIGVNRATLNRYEKGKLEPGVWVLQKIVRTYEVNCYWLLTGEAEMEWRGSRPPRPEEAEDIEERIESVMAEKRDAKTSDLIYMATRILESNWKGKRSLVANIKTFYESLLMVEGKIVPATEVDAVNGERPRPPQKAAQEGKT